MKPLIPSFIPLDRFSELAFCSEITLRRIIKDEKQDLLNNQLLRIDRSMGNRYLLSRQLLSRYVHFVFLDAINQLEQQSTKT